MPDGWRKREHDSLLAERRLLTWLCAACGALAVVGFLVASLVALVAGSIGATVLIGRLAQLRVAERLLSAGARDRRAEGPSP